MIEERIRKIIVENAELDESVENIASDALLRDVGVDSIEMITIIAMIEQEFSLEITDEDMIDDNFMCIDKIVTFVKKRTK